MGKKKEVLARDVTEDDITDLNPHSSKFDNLVHVTMKARELYKEAAKKLKISEEEEEPLNEEFHCPTPEAAAKRERMLMREKNLKKPLEVENPKRVFIANQKKLFECEEEGDAKVVKKKNRTDNCKEVNGVLPKEILDKIRRQNGTKVKLVIQKKLFKTDLRSGPNRLSMPLSQLQEPDFLTEDEQEFLWGRTPDGRNTNGIPVLFIEPNGDLNSELVLKWWNMPKEPGKNTSSIYLFNGKWRDVFEKHKLDKHTIVQVWSFRYARDNCDGKLGFSMVIVERDENGDRNKNANENRKGKGKGNGSSGSRSETGGSQSGE
ncbi:hypothetical protein Vadar_003867 [Vaccinium darrowii]|uniref:Uncharacterized protein n=1 Tax=Vaccinium darrowii TaxID=229202 RepID=A0ACB7Z1H2_9ERIC|nr:hypothetical protein Vadar_003867 [Vaccinium darrowii]